MANWLEPLKLEIIFMNIFAGTPDYFIALALIIISGMAGFFRMTTLSLFFMLGLFLFMIYGGGSMHYMLAFFAIIAGLVIGYVISRLWDR